MNRSRTVAIVALASCVTRAGVGLSQGECASQAHQELVFTRDEERGGRCAFCEDPGFLGRLYEDESCGHIPRRPPRTCRRRIIRRPTSTGSCGRVRPRSPCRPVRTATSAPRVSAGATSLRPTRCSVCNRSRQQPLRVRRRAGIYTARLDEALAPDAPVARRCRNRRPISQPRHRSTRRSPMNLDRRSCVSLVEQRQHDHLQRRHWSVRIA